MAIRPRLLTFALSLLAFAPLETPAAKLTIRKAIRILEYRDAITSRQFRIGLGSAPTGAKTRQGDRRTPEGAYFITHKNPKSQFFLSLGVSYPNLDDARLGLRSKLISQRQYDAIEAVSLAHRQPPQNTSLGGNIFIHGRGSETDWTWGCIALDDADMKFLFDRIAVGDQVTILP